MVDYISRQAAIDAIHNKMILVGSYLTDSSVGFEFAEDEINNLPSANVVPVVRCKECKFRENDDFFCTGRGFPYQLVPDDGFCDKGERKE